MRLLILFLLSTQFTFGQTPEVELFNFTSSICDKESDSGRLRTRIINKELKENVLTIHIAATATCCVEFIPITSYSSGVLNLDIEETGMECECSCCYEFIYQIKGIVDDKIKITFRNAEIEQSEEKYKTFPIEFKILNGDTVNLIDKYGFRQGVWVLPNDTLTKVIYELSDDQIMGMTKFYSNGLVLSEISSEKILYTYDNTEIYSYIPTKYIEYYESGAKRKECYNDNKEHYTERKCKEWNEKGALVYEGDYRKNSAN
jgi:hypothetical protein